jgi:hypothetical protein
VAQCVEEDAQRIQKAPVWCSCTSQIQDQLFQTPCCWIPTCCSRSRVRRGLLLGWTGPYAPTVPGVSHISGTPARVVFAVEARKLQKSGHTVSCRGMWELKALSSIPRNGWIRKGMDPWDTHLPTNHSTKYRVCVGMGASRTRDLWSRRAICRERIAARLMPRAGRPHLLSECRVCKSLPQGRIVSCD